MYLVAIHIHPIRPYVKKGIRIFNFTENPDSLYLFHLSVPTQDTLPHTTIQEPSISYTFLLSYVIWKFFAFLPRGVQRGAALRPFAVFSHSNVILPSAGFRSPCGIHNRAFAIHAVIRPEFRNPCAIYGQSSAVYAAIQPGPPQPMRLLFPHTKFRKYLINKVFPK